MHASNYNDHLFKNYLPEIENQILHGSIDLSNPKSHVMNSIEAMISEAPLQTTIALHAYQILQSFLRGACNFCSRKQEKDSSMRKLQFIVKRIYVNSYKCFLSSKAKYSFLFREGPLKAMAEQDEWAQMEDKYLQQDPRTTVLRDILSRLDKISKITVKYEMRKELNHLIEHYLLVLEPTSYLEEICLNWIKGQVQKDQDEKQLYLCCQIHFERASTSKLTGFSETANQEFKDYRWPLENPSIIFHLTKTVVGFLNTTGGIIYVGLKEDKTKLVEVKGIQLSPKQKEQFLYFMLDTITKEVYPKDGDRNEYDQSQDESCVYRRRIKEEFGRVQSKERNCEYTIDRFMTVDFLDVYDGQTYLNSIGNEAQRLYIARIKIKVGDQRELYHVINKARHIPEAYQREDKSVKKKDMKEFYELFYRKISGIQNKTMKNERTEPHSLCRFNPNPILPNQFN